MRVERREKADLCVVPIDTQDAMCSYGDMNAAR